MFRVNNFLALIAIMPFIIFGSISPMTGIQASAEKAADVSEEDKKVQVNNEREQFNECKNSDREVNDLNCNNILSYGVVCMPGFECKIENDQVPFEITRLP
jgi:hypothetical protein